MRRIRKMGCGLIGLFVLIGIINFIAPDDAASPTSESRAIAINETPIVESAPAIPPPAPTPAWYVGGSLHRATWADWKAAASQNKLATAADWVVAADKDTYYPDAELLRASTEIVACVDGVADTASAQWGETSPVVDVAAVCLLTLLPNN